MTRIRRMFRFTAKVAIFCAASFAMAQVAAAKPIKKPFQSPEVLVLGDSQITFGSGPNFLDFFENLGKSCNIRRKDPLGALARPSVAVIGVRSTSLGTWARRDRRGKSAICDVDPKWKVNAGSYGTVNRSDNIYVQIGKGRNYQFCSKGKSAFETMFRPDYYKPKLLFLTFLGNSSSTWAKDRGAALRDVRAAMSQLPKGLPCVFMTSAPTYQKRVVDMRLRAQENLKWAFRKTGNRCVFVEGFTKQTIAANLGNPRHFRRRASGKVKDPFHPNTRAAHRFFALQQGAICAAVRSALDGPKTRRFTRKRSKPNMATQGMAAK